MPSPRTLRALLGPGLMLLVVSVATCRLDMLLKPTANRAHPSLSISPTTVLDSARAGSDDVRRIPVAILNGGGGDDEFEWEADEDHFWIRLSERDGTLPDTITITLDPDDLDPGTHQGTITITSPDMPDAEATISVTFIAQRAGLVVTPGAIAHSANVGSGATFSDTLRISNGGNGPLVWTVRKERPWITLGANAGVGAGVVPVTINTSGLPAGTHHDEIVVTAPGAEDSPARIGVTVTIFAPGLAVTPGAVRDTVPPGSTEPQSHTLQVSNSGSGSMTWTATKTVAWVSLSAFGGTAPQDVVVTLNPTGLPSGAHHDDIVFTSPEATNGPIVVPVDLVISQPGLNVSPGAIQDAARQGETAKRLHSLTVTNSGPGLLFWGASANRAWIAVDPTVGAAPGTIAVTLDPSGLPPGTHEGQVVVTAPGAAGSPATVPVSFTIQAACNEIVLAPDEVRQGVLNAADCEAPHRPGRFANWYRVDLSAGDEFSIRLTANFNAYLFLVDAAGGVLAENDECSPETGTACIMNFRIPATGRYFIEATSAGPGETGSLTISVARERAPGDPQGLGQFQGDGSNQLPLGGTATSGTVVLKAIVSDPNAGAVLRLDVEVKQAAVAFTGENLRSAGGLSSGALGTVSFDPVAATGYHWRARTCDQTNRCSAWMSFPQPTPNPEDQPDFVGPSASGTSRAGRAPGGTP